jgi:hypothetical protein
MTGSLKNDNYKIKKKFFKFKYTKKFRFGGLLVIVIIGILGKKIINLSIFFHFFRILY